VCHWVGSWDRKRLVKGGVATIQKVRGRGYFWGRIGGASPYVFFAVDDIGAAIERVRQLGGEVDEVNDEGTRTRSRGLAASSFVATTRARGSGSTSRLRHSRGRDHEEVRGIRSDEALAFTAEDLYRDSRQLRRSRVGARTSARGCWARPAAGTLSVAKTSSGAVKRAGMRGIGALRGKSEGEGVEDLTTKPAAVRQLATAILNRLG
jgi:hypothetical protein